MTTEIDRQTRILDAAERHFLADGFERSSVESIAKGAHVSKREIYRDWKSKADLFVAVASRILADNDVDLSTVHPQQDEMRSVLGFLARHLLDQFASDRSRDIFRASIAAIRDFPDVANDIHNRRLTAWVQFGGYFEKLIADDKIRVTSAAAAANRFGSLCIEGLRYLLSYPAPTESVQTVHGARMVDLFLNGYQAGNLPVDPTEESALTTCAAPLEARTPVEIRMSPEKQSIMSDALLTEFLEKGYYHANFAQVAGAIHASKSSIYRQFGSKAGAFEQLVKRRVQQLADMEPFSLRSGETLNQTLVRLCRNILDRHLAPENIAIIRALIEESRTFPGLGQIYYESRLQLTTRDLRAVLCKYEAAEPDDLAISAFHILATYGSRFIAFPTPPEEDERAALSAEAASIFLIGVSGNRHSI
ncbi:TetR/AcrR family transcriptional regulator [Sphingobium sp. EM0848]|uniref:TetR/AcrR family transcriptional regulator n=1 Tax=Sphingobium sp. EM0848 TaxID=2743473 RepID=UPI00159C8C2F|nr:TetR/AcrR family transcriptional regulator [Sphingobium sp. EM0848]